MDLPQRAARELNCDRLIYIPAAVNPLKAGADAATPAPAVHRLAMLRLALNDTPNTEISTVELDRPGPSYTIDTLRALTKSLKAQATGQSPVLFLLIGADQALEFHRWKDWQEILPLATPAVMLREPWDAANFAAAVRERYGKDEAHQWERWMLRTLPTMTVSASDIRQHLRRGESLAGLVHPQVRPRHGGGTGGCPHTAIRDDTA